MRPVKRYRTRRDTQGVEWVLPFGSASPGARRVARQWTLRPSSCTDAKMVSVPASALESVVTMRMKTPG